MKYACALFSILPLLACSDSSRDAFDGEQGPFGGSPSPDSGGPESCVEAFAETKRAVDIVVSIDQSASMGDELESLRSNINLLPSLLTASGLDYRIVMVAGVGREIGNVCIPPPLGGEDCGSNGTIFRAVDQHIESTDMLAFLWTTLDRPTPGREWRDFLRPSVLKVFVPITDDDSSDMPATEFEGELHRRHASLFGTENARNYVFFSVIGANDFPDATKCPTAMNSGRQYQQLATRTNGKWFSVCRPSLGSVLKEIGEAVAETVSCEVAIPDPPSNATLDLTKINVRVAHANGSPGVVAQDSAHPCAGGADGWQFSDDRKKIILCGSVCSSVRSDPEAKFTVGFGCNTIVR